MTRPEDWPARLYRFLEGRRSIAFDWARHNCAFLACDWIAEMLGVDPAAEYREKVTDALSAARVMKAAGGLEQIARDACALHRWPEVRPASARRGDIVFYHSELGEALGICDGRKSFFPGRTELMAVRTLNSRLAWRIA